MKVVFMGTPALAIPFLDSLVHASHQVGLVLTGPDKPVGRGGKISPPPVKVRAKDLGIPIYQPEKLRREEVADKLGEVGADLFVIVAYRLLPPRLIEIPKLGCLNVHYSLLPKYRGAAPVAWALVKGETETGVTIMLIDKGMDTGAILLQEACPIKLDDDTPNLTGRLTEIGIPLMLKAMEDLAQGKAQPVLQDNALATPAPKLKKEDGSIDWTRPAADIHNLRRGLTPWPGTYTTFGGKIFKIHGTRIMAEDPAFSQVSPGQILGVSKEGLQVGCGASTGLLLTEVQPEGKRRMSGENLIMGRYLKVGDLLK
ncbi:methionyl-tRNA formyltransferase [Acidobacteriota bacterium]